MDNKEIVVFGAGLTGQKFVYQNDQIINISCFWDNKKTGEILGYQIQKPKADKNCFIIVTSLYYSDIRKQLLGMGYIEFDDFIPYQIFRKKMAIAYGNCHILAIKDYMECHKEFSSEYGFYPLMGIYQMKGLEWDYADILHHCDLFLHQSIRKDNAYGEQYSSDYMLRYVRADCITVACPNLYGMPKYLFPQLGKEYDWKSYSWYKSSVRAEALFYIDSNIVSWILQGKNIGEVKMYLKQGGGTVYSKYEIKNMWEDFLIKLDKREQKWDIKIMDYIIQNQRHKKIFCDYNHITSDTAHIMADRILKYIGYKNQFICELPILDDLEVFIYEDVKEAMDIEFDETCIRKWHKGNCLNNCEMDFDEYINQIFHYTKFRIKK